MHYTVDQMIFLLSFFEFSIKKPVVPKIWTDAQNLVTLLHDSNPQPEEKHLVIQIHEIAAKISDLKERRKAIVPLHALADLPRDAETRIAVAHIPGVDNPADCLTKAMGAAAMDTLFKRVLLPRTAKAQPSPD